MSAKTAKKKEIMNTFTQVKGLRQFILAQVESGALVKRGGVETLYEKAMKRYKEKLSHANLRLSQTQFAEMVEDLVWTVATQDSLTGYLRHAHNPDEALAKWHEGYPNIPLDWVKEQAKWVRGVSSVVAPVAMIPGLGGYLEKGWMKRAPDHPLPKSSFAKPYKIALPGDAKCGFAVFNGVNLGLVYNPVIEENPLRRKLAEAELNGVDVVFLTNVFALEIVKAGGAQLVYRSRLAGLNTNVELLDPDYREEAERLVKEQPDDELLYETPIERVVNLLTGLHKIMMKPDGKDADGKPKFKPEFSGKVCLVLGYNDEQLINTLAYWVVNYLRILKQNVLMGEMKLQAKVLANARKQGNDAAREKAEKALRRLTKQHTRTVTSGTTPQEVNRFAPVIRSIIIGKLKQLVPNIEVIGQGTTHVQINDKPVVTLHIPGHKRVTDSLLAQYASKCGPRIIRKEMAKVTVICHPFALQMRDTVREADHDGRRDSVQVFVAPILVDGKFLREELSDVIRSTHPIQRAIFHDHFKPGALRFSFHGEGNVVAQDFWPVTRPLKPSHVKRKGSQTSDALYPDFGTAPYIWYAIATDPHLGGRARQTVWCDELGESLGMFDATVHSMRKSGYLGSEKFGIHIWSCNDDPTQAHNYPTHMQPDPVQLTNIQLEEVCKEFDERMNAASGADRLKIFREFRKFMDGQINARGLDWVQHHIEEVYDRLIGKNLEYYSAVLLRAKRSGLIVKPVSEHYGIVTDPRDLGILNWGSGNHFDHSVEGMLTEGFLYARDLQNKLLGREEWKGQAAFIKRYVRAPLYSNFFCAWGTIRVGNGYEWGMDLRPSPTRMGSWGDTLLGAVRNDPLRGNPTRIMEGRMRIQTYGDKHFFGTAVTPDVIFHMCASGTHTDRYGEHGFPPNNTGVSFLGIPVEGPRVPLLFRYLRYEQIARLAEPGVTFDWERFLPNPA